MSKPRTEHGSLQEECKGHLCCMPLPLDCAFGDLEIKLKSSLWGVHSVVSRGNHILMVIISHNYTVEQITRVFRGNITTWGREGRGSWSHGHRKDLNWDLKPKERDSSGIQQKWESQGKWPCWMGTNSKEVMSPHPRCAGEAPLAREKQQGSHLSPCPTSPISNWVTQAEMVITEVGKQPGTWFTAALGLRVWAAI